MAVSIFVTSLAFLLYSFAGYPFFLFILSIFRRKKTKRGEIYPAVDIIIPVHNEENSIEAKINNCLQSDYPKDKLKILISSDNSTDQTEEIVRKFPSERVTFLAVPFRGGKVMAQNFAVNFCDAEIIIFTDVAISVDADAIKKIVENFHDPSIGTVSCRDAVVEGSQQGLGEGGYIKYDMLVRSLTTSIGTLIGVTGGFYATRREIAKGGWNPAFPPDFYVALRTIKRGLRVIEDSRVKAYYKTAQKEWDELPRKVRTITRGMTALFSRANRDMLNPLKHGLATFELLSHKLCRWALPFFLMTLFFSNFFLTALHPAALLFFIAQLILYCFVGFSFWGPSALKRWKIFRFFFYFAIANVSLILSWQSLLTGKRFIKWQPTKR